MVPFTAGSGSVSPGIFCGQWWRRRISEILVVAGVVAGAALADAAPGELRVVGTDLLGGGFAEAIKTYARNNELPLKLALEGSHAGLAQLESGAADFGLLVLPPGAEPPGTLFKSVPLGYHVVVLLVPASNPLPQITYRELGGVYGESESTSFTRWGELGLTGAWASRSIAPQAASAGTGLALELFRRVALSDGKLRSVVLLQETTDSLLRKLEADEGSIALAGRVTLASEKIRILPVAKADRDVAFGPTPENVHAGDYPLRLPLWLVVRRETGRTQLNFLRFLLSDDVAPLLERAGLVVVPLSARNQFSFDLEQL